MNSSIFKTMSVVAAIAAITCSGKSFAASDHRGHAGTSMSSAAHESAPRTIAGRIVAVRRVSRVISIQTAEGTVHQVTVPESATISSHEGVKFSNVRSGQNVHVSAVNDPSHGLVAHSVSIP
jgi:hypothetical protein